MNNTWVSYFIKGSPLLFVALGYFAFREWSYVDTDDARIAAEVIQIKSKIPGVIEKIFVYEKQEVHKGDALVLFDDTTFKKALKQAELELSQAQKEKDAAEIAFNKAETLQKDGRISLQKLETIKKEFDELSSVYRIKAEAADQAKKDLEDTKISSPEDGNITRSNVNEGNFVPKGQLVIGVTPSRDRFVIGNFSVDQLAKIKVGNSAVARLEGLGVKTYDGEVESMFKRNTASFSHWPPEVSGPGLTKNSSRTIVKVRLTNLTPADKIKLQDGLPASLSIKTK